MGRLRSPGSSRSGARNPRLVAIFAITSLATFLAIGAILTIVAVRHVEERALRQAQQHATFVTRSLVQNQLRDESLDRPFRGARFRRLQRFTTTRLLRFPIVRVKIWSQEGTVVYSDEPRLIGEDYQRERGLDKALRGEAVSYISALKEPENPFERPLAEKLLETYVPLYQPGDQPGAPSAVAELYQDYAGVQAQIDQMLQTLIPTLVVGLAVLYVLHLPLAWRIDRVLSKKNARLEAQAQQLGRQAARLKKHLQNERETVTELANLNRLKGEFVDVASHELRNPLAAIAAAVKTLGRLHAEDPRLRDEVLSLADRQVDRLMDLTDRLLLSERLENGRFPVSLGEFELGELVDEVIAGLGEGGERATLEVADDLLMYSDRHAVQEIITNLVENAIKFSPDDSPYELRASSADESVLVSVRDHGPGIQSAALDRIFERFYREGSPGASEQPGVGLGLSLVKQLVTQLGGTIEVSSRPGVGSEFTVTLPARAQLASAEDGESVTVDR